MERPPKRQKLAISLEDLPQDLLEIISSHLHTTDTLNLSLASITMRKRLVPIIFTSIQASWEQIIEFQEKPDSGFSNNHHVRKLRINTSNSFNEYKQNTFGQLLSPETFPRLAEVAVNLVNLSYWLKYNRCLHVQLLTLYCDNVFRGVKIFDLSHVDNFANLRLLCLHNYHFNWDGNGPVPKIGLEDLLLHDCTWEYPFDLANFNLSNTLRHVTVSYSNNNSFMLLERFISFLNDPFPNHSSSLRTMTIRFVDITENKKLLTPTILKKFLTAFSGIESLDLSGWTAEVGHLRGLLTRHVFESPVVLVLRVESLDVADVEGYMSQVKVRNLKLKVVGENR